jgi:hypothetical protein
VSILAAAAVCSVVLMGCGKEGGDGKSQGATVLKVNAWSYTTADLEKELVQELRRAPREVQPFFASKDGQKQFLERVVRRELLLQEAEKQKIGDQPDIQEQVVEEFALYRRSGPTAGGLEYAKEILEQSLGHSKAQEVLDDIVAGSGGGRPFDWIKTSHVL